MSNVLSVKASSTFFCCRGSHSIPNYPGAVRPLLSEYHLSEVPGSEEPSGVSEDGRYDAYVADVENNGDSCLFDLSGDLYMGHRASILVGCDQLKELCSTASHSPPTPFVDLICLADPSVPALSDLPDVEARGGALEATLETSDERISTLQLQVASNDADVAAKVAPIDGSAGRVRIAEGAFLMSVTTASTRVHGYINAAGGVQLIPVR